MITVNVTRVHVGERPVEVLHDVPDNVARDFLARVGADHLQFTPGAVVTSEPDRLCIDCPHAATTVYTIAPSPSAFFGQPLAAEEVNRRG